MATPEDLSASETYQAILTEVIVRSHNIDILVTGRSALHATLAREACFLQLRMMCELVALGCLVCHGDIKATKSKALQKAYVPADILGRLEDLHPDFYPFPHKAERRDGVLALDPPDFDFLKKEDLIALWARCGSHLHKGSLRRLVSVRDAPSMRTDDIIEPQIKLLKLLANHHITRIGGQFHFLVEISQRPRGNEIDFTIQVAIAEAPTDNSEQRP